MGRRLAPQHVTIKDIADQLGLTHATVSRALNDHPQTNVRTKARVRAAAEALGYVPNAAARAMRGQSSTLFGLVVPDIENPFYGTVAKNMARGLLHAGMQLMLAISEDDPATEHRQVLALRSARVAGIAITPTARPLPATLALLKDVSGVQLVRRCGRGPKATVLLGDEAGVEDAVSRLLDLGHRRIAYVGASLDLSTGADRFRGFKAAHVQRDLPVRRAYVKIGAPRPMFGREALLELFSDPQPPTAALVASPQLTLGALEASKELGLVIPRDLAFISYGDAEWFSATQPSISAVRLPIDELARAATAILLSANEPAIAAQQTSRPLVFPTTYIARGTTTAPRDE